ncbi:hypothetical protein EV126DRAFT_102792 [Verticillium dahliae]|nr:hypothetical protein EV126DRAFT_164688 [Verticillium dahliae]KAH6708035.1 hypothetical protein EV126DRAFT_102792 [Verticillium dahliae]
MRIGVPDGRWWPASPMLALVGRPHTCLTVAGVSFLPSACVPACLPFHSVRSREGGREKEQEREQDQGGKSEGQRARETVGRETYIPRRDRQTTQNPDGRGRRHVARAPLVALPARSCPRICLSFPSSGSGPSQHHPPPPSTLLPLKQSPKPLLPPLPPSSLPFYAMIDGSTTTPSSSRLLS